MHTTAAAIAAHTQPRCSTIATTEGVIIAQSGRTDAAPAAPVRTMLAADLVSTVERGRITLRRALAIQAAREATK